MTDPAPYHVYPLGDLREHVTEGGLCPCLPRSAEDGGVLVHNSYDGREGGVACRDALDMLGGSLAEHGHTWTDQEREKYEKAIQLLDMHWPLDEEGKPWKNPL